MRLRPPMLGDRRPNLQGLKDLRLFLGDLPHLMEIAGARHARVSGGAHLSVAFALGAALPSTLLGRVEVVDTAGNTWAFSDNVPAPVASARLLEITDSSPHEATSGDALLYLDLLPTRSDPAFDRLLEARHGQLASVFHIRTVAEGNLLPEDAGAIVAGSVPCDTSGSVTLGDVRGSLAPSLPMDGGSAPWAHAEYDQSEPVRVGRWSR